MLHQWRGSTVRYSSCSSPRVAPGIGCQITANFHLLRPHHVSATCLNHKVNDDDLIRWDNTFTKYEETYFTRSVCHQHDNIHREKEWSCSARSSQHPERIQTAATAQTKKPSSHHKYRATECTNPNKTQARKTIAHTK